MTIYSNTFSLQLNLKCSLIDNNKNPSEPKPQQHKYKNNKDHGGPPRKKKRSREKDHGKL